MLRKMLDSGWSGMVIFCNTGKERTQTLDFVHEVETRWNVTVVWLEYHRVLASSIMPGIFPTPRRNLNLSKASEKGETTHWFRQVDYSSASRNGEPFDELIGWMSALPNVVSRVCSVQLKMRTSMRYLFSNGVREYNPIIGIRRDESHRATQILASCDSFERPKFPLIEMGISKNEVDSYWKSSDFDLDLKDYEGNCDLCFLKAKWKRIKLVKENPGMVDWWKGWEAKKQAVNNGKVFRMGEHYSDLEIYASAPQQMSLIPEEQDIPCSCVERGFEPE